MTATNNKNSLSHKTQLLLYPANLVGFFRIGLLITLLFSFKTHPVLSVNLYIISLLLDGVDGYIARLFNQTTAFGTILDMVTDRASVALLFLVLSQLYNSLWSFFAILMLLDLSSHLAIIYSTAIEHKSTHKQTLLNVNTLLRLYYNNRWVLSLVCLSHDLCLCGLYYYHFSPSLVLKAGILFLLPGLALKTAIHILQLYFAFRIVTKEE